MPALEWVLDTNVLAAASNTDDPLFFEAAQLLGKVQDTQLLAVDSQGEIESEYRSHINRSRHMIRWWEQMHLRSGVVYRAGFLTRAQRRYLLDTRFDPSDWKFVAVALRASRLLVTEDSDYWEPKVATYLSDNLGMSVLSIEQALRRL